MRLSRRENQDRTCMKPTNAFWSLKPHLLSFYPTQSLSTLTCWCLPLSSTGEYGFYDVFNFAVIFAEGGIWNELRITYFPAELIDTTCDVVLSNNSYLFKCSVLRLRWRWSGSVFKFPFSPNSWHCLHVSDDSWLVSVRLKRLNVHIRMLVWETAFVSLNLLFKLYITDFVLFKWMVRCLVGWSVGSKQQFRRIHMEINLLKGFYSRRWTFPDWIFPLNFRSEMSNGRKWL